MTSSAQGPLPASRAHGTEGLTCACAVRTDSLAHALSGRSVRKCPCLPPALASLLWPDRAKPSLLHIAPRPLTQMTPPYLTPTLTDPDFTPDFSTQGWQWVVESLTIPEVTQPHRIMVIRHGSPTPPTESCECVISRPAARGLPGRVSVLSSRSPPGGSVQEGRGVGGL